jgi:hypothetical protein
MKASCRDVRPSLDGIWDLGGLLGKGEGRVLSSRRRFATGSGTVPLDILPLIALAQ